MRWDPLKDILSGSVDFAAWLATRTEKEAYALLLRWSEGVLAAL